MHFTDIFLQKTRFQTFRVIFIGLLQVSDGIQEQEELTATAPAGGPSGLELLNSKVYIGGVPPNFNKTGWDDVMLKPFSGCLKKPQAEVNFRNINKLRCCNINENSKANFGILKLHSIIQLFII